jgi:alpha-beta hydrolase superfamily lysophospholipase
MHDPKTLDADLAVAEEKVQNLRAGAEKEIVWAGKAGEITDVAVVYVHGFSATKHEIQPVPNLVANALGANLYLARLEGHGRDGAAMGEVAWQDWLQDTCQALDIGRAIGRRVVVVSCSTGCTLVTCALAMPGMDKNIAGNVFVSPNFGMASKALNLVLGLPLAPKWLPMIAGQERGFEPINEAHAQWWTTRYPSKAVFTMMDAVRAAWRVDARKLSTPTLLMLTENDRVVAPSETRRFMLKWGGPVREQVMIMGPDDDANGHVIAGDVFAPQQNQPAVDAILHWWAAFRAA